MIHLRASLVSDNVRVALRAETQPPVKMSSSAGIRDKSILGPAARNLSSRGPDYSQLKAPIRTSLSGTKQVIHALECGTGEVKDYLLEEINLMYECKTCFSVFRSIANLVAHKRTFCKSKYQDLQHVYDDKGGGGAGAVPEFQTVVVEAEPVCSSLAVRRLRSSVAISTLLGPGSNLASIFRISPFNSSSL